MLFVVCLDIFVDVFQLDGVLSVCWVVDDDLLAKDMSFESDSQKLEYKLFVHVYVEYRRVVGCLVGDENRQWSQYGSGKSFAKPYCPYSASAHSVSCVVENKEGDENQYRDDDRESQSSFSYDGTQWRTDEEEDEARQRQRELVDGLYLVVSYQSVALIGDHTLEVEVVHGLLHVRGGVVYYRQPALCRHLLEQRVDIHLCCSSFFHSL